MSDISKFGPRTPPEGALAGASGTRHVVEDEADAQAPWGEGNAVENERAHDHGEIMCMPSAKRGAPELRPARAPKTSS